MLERVAGEERLVSGDDDVGEREQAAEDISLDDLIGWSSKKRSPSSS